MHIALSAGIFIILISPFLIPIVKVSLSAERLSNMWGQELFVTDLLSPITPPALHTLSQMNNHALAPLYFTFKGNAWETTRFVGYLVLFLAIFAAVKQPFRLTGFWCIIGLLYLILSFGPKLHVYGKPMLNYMPYYFFSKIPFLNLARIPSRFALITMLCLAVLAAYAFTWMSRRWKQTSVYGVTLPTVLFVLSAATIVFEFSVIPLPVTHVTIPFFYESLAKEQQDFAIMEVPLFDWRGNDEYMFLQTFHRKRLLFGALSHFPKENLGYLQHPIFKILALPKEYTEKYKDVDTSILQQYGVRFIIVHPEYFRDSKDLELILQYLNSKFLKLQQPDREIIVYTVNA